MPLSRILLVATMLMGCSAAANPSTKTECNACETAAAPEPVASTAPVLSAEAVEDLQAGFKRAIAAAGPAVVSVYSTKTVSARGFGGLPFGHRDPLFDLFGGRMQPQPPPEFQQQGLGSGFILDAGGYILTNNHVVADADEVRVKLADDREFDATVIGTDPPTDLALLKIEAADLQPVELADSDHLEVGDWVLAIGNPFGLPRTVSSGIVSAKGRANVGIVDYEDFIQTDAAVNPGNSGGPLVDLNGRVVGINTAIASRSGGNNGIAFAVPVNLAKNIVEQLRGDGKVVRGHLGIMISDLSSEMAESFQFDGKGILVQDVVAGSAAAKAGVANGDIIQKLDGEAVTTVPAFRAEIAKHKPGVSVTLEIFRDGKVQDVAVALGEAPGTQAADTVAPGTPPKIGISLQDLSLEQARRRGLEAQGVLIRQVAPGSPAARAGVMPGDLLESIAGKPVRSSKQALSLLRRADLEAGIRLRLSRDGRGRFVLIRARP